MLYLCVLPSAQKYLKQLRTPKEVKRNGDSVSVSNPSFYLRPMVHTASSKTCLVSKPTKSRQLSKPSPDQSKVRGCGQKKDQGDSVSDNSKDQSPSDSGKGRSMGPNLYIALAAAHFKLSEKKWRKENQTLKYVNNYKSVLIITLLIIHMYISLYNLYAHSIFSVRPRGSSKGSV